MDYRRLCNGGTVVSSLGLGTLTFGNEADEGRWSLRGLRRPQNLNLVFVNVPSQLEPSGAVLPLFRPVFP